MKVHITRSEAMALLVLIGYAWEAGTFAPHGNDKAVVKRIFKNWPDLMPSFGWIASHVEEES